MAVDMINSHESDDIFAGENPFEIFVSWLKQAKLKEVNDPDAIALATVDKEGVPNVRIVLLRVIESESFVFFTNYNSKKGGEILSSGKAAFVCHWKSIRRQIRVRGVIAKDETNLSNEYFSQRPLESKIGAWASRQSTELKNKEILFEKIKKCREELGSNPKKPPFWGGFRLTPLEIEFWRDGAYRIHDRFLWKRDNIEGQWSVMRLNP